MITHIDGILEEKNPAYVIIDVNGIGYLLYITLNTYSEVPEKGRVRLLTQFVVREDAQLLYGFSTDQERKMFKALINVSGVGASTAMLILSSLKPEELVAAIPAIQPVSNKDLKRLASGFGQRIDPFLKVKRMHYGLDFSIKVGTPIMKAGSFYTKYGDIFVLFCLISIIIFCICFKKNIYS